MKQLENEGLFWGEGRGGEGAFDSVCGGGGGLNVLFRASLVPVKECLHRDP